MTADTVHPRPQLVRDRWTDLCGAWQFALDSGDDGLTGRWFETPGAFDRTIVVPYPPESKLSGVHDTSYLSVVWYRRTFATPPLADGERLLLHFGAVDYRAQVWVNGAFVGDHEGGHTPFTFDVTSALVGGDEQVVTVRAEDRPTDVSQPRGKQDWQLEPHGIWYHRTTGIWQPVWLEPVAATHIAELQWTPDVPAARVGVEVRLARPAVAPSRLRVTLRFHGELLAEHTVLVTGDEYRGDIALPAVRNGERLGQLLWSPENPHLVDAEVVLEEAGAVVDQVTSYLGMRSVKVGDGRFLLNGQQYFARMVLEQGYWPESHLAAPDAGALRREVELIKELGFNGVRIHQKIEDPRFLYWCDRLGLLVWDEMPSAYEFGPVTTERFVREWLEVVRRDRSHPCLVAWVPLNESWGVRHMEDVPAQRSYATALYHLTKALDPTRPAISNDGWEHTESDIWSVHDYAPEGAGLRQRYGDADAVGRTLRDRRPARRRVMLGDPVHRGQPVMLTEFGGLSYTPEPGEQWWGYGTVGTPEQLEQRLADLVQAVLDSPELAGFCYTQLTDTEQERNGLLDEDRQPKLPLERIRDIMRRPAAAVPVELIDASRAAARRASAAERQAEADG